VDPLVQATGQPYAYTGDDPVNGVDPTGLVDQEDIGGGAPGEEDGGDNSGVVSSGGGPIGNGGFGGPDAPGGWVEVEPGAWVNEDTGQVEYSNTDPSDKEGDSRESDCLPGPGDSVRKVVNTEMPHAAGNAVERLGFPTPAAAREALQALGNSIEQSGLPAGTIDDTNASRILVPFGNGGYAVYQIMPNGNAVLRNVLNAR
jgi:hypothetical protein